MTDQFKMTFNGKDYTEADLTQEQKILVAHVQDLDAQISQLSFKLDQANVGRQAFMARLEVSLKQVEKTNADQDEQVDTQEV